MRVSLREEHGAIVPRVEEMRNKKEERRKLFVEVVEKLQKVSSEIFGSTEGVIMDGTDLSMKKLDGLEKRLLELENNKVFYFFLLIWYIEVERMLVV